VYRSVYKVFIPSQYRYRLDVDVEGAGSESLEIVRGGERQCVMRFSAFIQASLIRAFM
jgi:hypothetical protein